MLSLLHNTMLVPLVLQSGTTHGPPTLLERHAIHTQSLSMQHVPETLTTPRTCDRWLSLLERLDVARQSSPRCHSQNRLPNIRCSSPSLRD